MAKDIRKVKGKELDLNEIRRQIDEIKEKKKEPLNLIEEDDKKYPQEVLELIEAENEQRRDNHKHLDKDEYNLQTMLDAYEELPKI